MNTENGYGYTRAKVRVSDPATGKPKLHGLAVGVIEPDGGTEGLLSGRTVGPDSMRLLANFNVQQDESSGALTGELGKDTQTGAFQDPAILTNACKGGHGKHGAAKGKGKARARTRTRSTRAQEREHGEDAAVVVGRLARGRA